MIDGKPLRWVGSAFRELTGFPERARRAAGYNLRLVQDGGMPEDWKSIETVGPGTYEVRVRTPSPGPAEYRILYVAKFEEAIYVLHGFEKKTRTTPQHDLEIGRTRYAEMLEHRRRQRRRATGN